MAKSNSGNSGEQILNPYAAFVKQEWEEINETRTEPVSRKKFISVSKKIAKKWNKMSKALKQKFKDDLRTKSSEPEALSADNTPAEQSVGQKEPDIEPEVVSKSEPTGELIPELGNEKNKKVQKIEVSEKKEKKLKKNKKMKKEELTDPEIDSKPQTEECKVAKQKAKPVVKPEVKPKDIEFSDVKLAINETGDICGPFSGTISATLSGIVPGTITGTIEGTLKGKFVPHPKISETSVAKPTAVAEENAIIEVCPPVHHPQVPERSVVEPTALPDENAITEATAPIQYDITDYVVDFSDLDVVATKENNEVGDADIASIKHIEGRDREDKADTEAVPNMDEEIKENAEKPKPKKKSKKNKNKPKVKEEVENQESENVPETMPELESVAD